MKRVTQVKIKLDSIPTGMGKKGTWMGILIRTEKKRKICILKNTILLGLVACCFFLSTYKTQAQTTQNYMSEDGTTFIYSDLVNKDDLTTYKTISGPTIEPRVEMYDREANNGAGAWDYPEAYVFSITYDDDITSKINIRKSDYPDQADAKTLAIKYATMMGRIPAFLREGVNHINLMKGDLAWGGNRNRNVGWLDLQVDGEHSRDYERRKVEEETLIHESCHAALDYLYYNEGEVCKEEWQQIQNDDPMYISKYAFDFKCREDVAESFVAYLVVKYRNDRFAQETLTKITAAIPNRIKSFDERILNNLAKIDLYPFYRVVKIDNRFWMAENLRARRWWDASTQTIKDIKRVNLDEKDSKAAMYWHDNSPKSSNSVVYGPLYNWTTIKDCDVCPNGWRIPGQEDWELVLRKWYDKEVDGITIEPGAKGLTFAAYQLREKRETGDYWPNNGKATNSTGFSARPGGWLWNGKFYYLGKRSGWWGPKNNNQIPIMTKIADGDNGTWSAVASQNDILYIRCVKNVR